MGDKRKASGNIHLNTVCKEKWNHEIKKIIPNLENTQPHYGLQIISWPSPGAMKEKRDNTPTDSKSWCCERINTVKKLFSE